jgi:hypothetical protein
LPGLLDQLLDVLQQDVVADIVRQLVQQRIRDPEHLRVNQVFKDRDGGAGDKPFSCSVSFSSATALFWILLSSVEIWFFSALFAAIVTVASATTLRHLSESLQW